MNSRANEYFRCASNTEIIGSAAITYIRSKNLRERKMPKRFAIIAAALARAGRDIPVTFSEDALEKPFIRGRTGPVGATAADLAVRSLGVVHSAKPPLCVDLAYPRISRFSSTVDQCVGNFVSRFQGAD
jgi:hypothetical protein